MHLICLLTIMEFEQSEMRISRHLKKIGINTQNSTPKHNLPVK